MADLPMHIVRARTNNLKNVSLRIPKRKIVAFTGVSGSGKSSLLFDTIAAESQPQLAETYSTFVRNRLPHLGQPEADRLENRRSAPARRQRALHGRDGDGDLCASAPAFLAHRPAPCRRIQRLLIQQSRWDVPSMPGAG